MHGSERYCIWCGCETKDAVSEDAGQGKTHTLSRTFGGRRPLTTIDDEIIHDLEALRDFSNGAKRGHAKECLSLLMHGGGPMRDRLYAKRFLTVLVKCDGSFEQSAYHAKELLKELT